MCVEGKIMDFQSEVPQLIKDQRLGSVLQQIVSSQELQKYIFERKIAEANLWKSVVSQPAIHNFNIDGQARNYKKSMTQRVAESKLQEENYRRQFMEKCGSKI